MEKSLGERLRTQGAIDLSKPRPLDPKELYNLQCPCGNYLFEEKKIVKLVPIGRNNNKEVQYMPYNLLVCTKCHKDPSRKNDVNLPEELCYPALEVKEEPIHKLHI